MIDDLVTQKRNSACLKLLAIDSGKDINMGCDKWMAINLAGQVDGIPVLALLGGLQTIKG